MNNAFGVIAFLAGLVLAAWYSLKFIDWIHAVRYEWRKNRKKAVPASPGPETGILPDGYFADCPHGKCPGCGAPLLRDGLYLYCNLKPSLNCPAAPRRVEPAPNARVVGTFSVRTITPDRPSDPFLEKVRQEARALTGEAEAVNYPRGS